MRAGHENNDHCFWQNDLTKNGGFPFQFEMQGLAEGLIVTVNNKKLFFSDGRSPTTILGHTQHCCDYHYRRSAPKSINFLMEAHIT